MGPTTRRYVTSRSIAEDYDDYFADSRLFAYDTHLLGRWLGEPGRVVDLGCGTGRHLVALAAAGHRTVGVDVSGSMLRVAAKKLAARGMTSGLVRADVMDVGGLFAPHSFDYAICMFSTLGLIQGMANRVAMLRGVRRVLAPGGLFVVHVHSVWRNLLSAEGLAPMAGSALRWAMGRGEWGDKVLSEYRGIRDMTIHVFSRRELAWLLRQAGLEVVDVVALNSARDGAMRASVSAGVLANGYIVLARRPVETAFQAALESAQQSRRVELAGRDHRRVRP